MNFQQFSLMRFSGFFSLISIVVGLFFGSIVLYKAIKKKEKILLLFFFTIIFVLSPWFPSGFGYLYWLITSQDLSYTAYVFLGTAGIPIAIISWLEIYLSTILPKKKKILVLIYILFSIIFEFYLIYFLFWAPSAPVESLIGIIPNPENPMDIDYQGFIFVYLLISIILAVGTGLHFSLISMHIKEDPLIVWKGRFLFLGFSFFCFSAIFDALFKITLFLLMIIRISLILAIFFFYAGFISPKWLKNILSIPSDKE
ncbi:MAG: conserved membrane protein of unknown function [Promethearchaeota archaeon]|nr:MAG: conserved membrane protein of unknown function [Candidatus Lokiarchaeota archaeon]